VVKGTGVHRDSRVPLTRHIRIGYSCRSGSGGTCATGDSRRERSIPRRGRGAGSIRSCRLDTSISIACGQPADNQRNNNAETAEDLAGEAIPVKGAQAESAIPASSAWAPIRTAPMAAGESKAMMEWTASAAPTGSPVASASNSSRAATRHPAHRQWAPAAKPGG
jgi:hypothetical protein